MKKSLLFLVAVLMGTGLFAQECSDLFFSEYVEGSGNNKALEIYNSTDNAIDLSQYTINRYSNGDPDPTNTMILSGTIQAKGVVVAIDNICLTIVTDKGKIVLPIKDVVDAKITIKE